MFVARDVQYWLHTQIILFKIVFVSNECNVVKSSMLFNPHLTERQKSFFGFSLHETVLIKEFQLFECILAVVDMSVM